MRRKTDKSGLTFKVVPFFCSKSFFFVFKDGHSLYISFSPPPPTNLCILALRKGKLSPWVLAVLISVIFILCSIPLLPPLLFWLSVSSCLHISLLCLTPLSSSPFTLSVLVSEQWRTRLCVCVCVFFLGGWWGLHHSVGCLGIPHFARRFLSELPRFLDTPYKHADYS